MQFSNETDLLDFFAETGEAWLALVAADGDPYLLTAAEDGDAFTQTFRCEEEEGAALNGGPIDQGTRWLSSHEANWWPVTVVAPRPSGDEHHSIEELYRYRMLYNALAFNEMAKLKGAPTVVKSIRHSDGELCFGGGYFIVVAELPTGQVSNHYRTEHWSLFQLPVVDQPPAYDGHTPAEAADRLESYLAGDR